MIYDTYLDKLPVTVASGGPVNPPLRTAMGYALFEAYIDRVPYTFVGPRLDRRILMPLLREEDTHGDS